jgi:hypothetical protein
VLVRAYLAKLTGNLPDWKPTKPSSLVSVSLQPADLAEMAVAEGAGWKGDRFSFLLAAPLFDGMP